jgi:hypothetical protein
MKKLIILALLISSVTLRAEWLKGSLTFKDKTVKSGYVKYFEKADAKKVQFKTAPEAKSEAVSSEELTSVEMTLENGKTITMLHLHPATVMGIHASLHIEKGYLWFGTYYHGDFNVLSIYYVSANGAYMTNGSTSTLQYYINWPGDDYAALTSIVAKGAGIVIGNKKFIRETNKIIFKGKCEQMLKEFENESFKPKTIEDVIDYYEKNCGQKSQSTIQDKREDSGQ